MIPSVFIPHDVFPHCAKCLQVKEGNSISGKASEIKRPPHSCCHEDDNLSPYSLSCVKRFRVCCCSLIQAFEQTSMRGCTSVFKAHRDVRNLEGGLDLFPSKRIEIAEYLVLTDPLFPKGLKGFHKINQIWRPISRLWKKSEGLAFGRASALTFPPGQRCLSGTPCTPCLAHRELWKEPVAPRAGAAGAFPEAVFYVPVPAAGPAGLCPGSRAAQVSQNCPAGFPHTQPPSLHSTLLAGLCSGLREAAVLFQEDVMDLQQGTYGSWCLASAVRGSGSSDSGKLLKVSVEKLILPQ